MEFAELDLETARLQLDRLRSLKSSKTIGDNSHIPNRLVISVILTYILCC